MTDEQLIIPAEFEIGIDLDNSESICMRLGIIDRTGTMTSVRLEVEDARNIANSLLSHVNAVDGLRARFEGNWADLVAMVDDESQERA